MRTIKLSALAAALVAGLSFSFTAPDEIGTATIDSNYCITLEGTEIHEQYLIDVSGLNITTGAEAKEIFGQVMNNLRDFEQFDGTAQTVIMNIHVERTGPTAWTKTQWDDYFATLCQ